MFYFENTGRQIDNLKFKDLELEKDRETLSSEVFQYKKTSEENYNQKPELNQKAVNLTNNTFTKEQQPNYETQKAVEFKAKALFELEQVIIGIEQLKQTHQ